MSELGPIKAVQVNQQVYEAVEAAIVRCELEPGSVLGDRQLAEVLNVSRTPVRDALHRLEASGLVERRGRAGWMVSGFALRDVRELFELRRILEPFGLARLLEGRDAGTVEELARFFDGFSGRMSREVLPDYLYEDQRFHKKIVECSENGRVVRFYEVVEKQIDRIRHYLSYRFEGRVEASLGEHKEICSAIADRDLAAANEALIRHLGNVEELFVALAEERGTGRRTGDKSA